MIAISEDLRQQTIEFTRNNPSLSSYQISKRLGGSPSPMTVRRLLKAEGIKLFHSNNKLHLKQQAIDLKKNDPKLTHSQIGKQLGVSTQAIGIWFKPEPKPEADTNGNTKTIAAKKRHTD